MALVFISTFHDIPGDKFIADISKDNETSLDALANYAKLELLKWPKTARKKKLGDIFPPADSDIWKNYDELEAAALAGKSDPSSSTTDSVASASADNNALKDAMEEVAESVASQASRVLNNGMNNQVSITVLAT